MLRDSDGSMTRSLNLSVAAALIAFHAQPAALAWGATGISTIRNGCAAGAVYAASVRGAEQIVARYLQLRRDSCDGQCLER